jgi:hypothetical protein
MQWIQKFKNSSRQTKWFILNWSIYGTLLIATASYCYMRLDYVRSYKASSQTQEMTKS